MILKTAHPVSFVLAIVFIVFLNYSTVVGDCPCTSFSNKTTQDGGWLNNSTWNTNPTPNCKVNSSLLIQHDVTANCDPMDVQGSACLSVDSADTLTITSDAGLTGNGDICVYGTLVVEGNLDIGGSGSLLLEGSLEVEDTVTVSGSGSIGGNGTANVGGGCSEFPDSIPCNDALPVRLSQFEAKPKEEKIILDWTTVTEQDCDYFIIERSAHDNNFKEIAREPGNGQSLISQHYKVIDDDPLKGLSYYRLKQVDIDRSVHIYKTVSVYLNSTSPAVYVTPNPSPGDNINIRVNGLAQKQVMVAIYNKLGELVYSKRTMVNDGRLNTYINPSSPLPAGLYFVTGRSDKQLFQEKLMIY